MSVELSQTVLEILRNAGWFEGRNVPIPLAGEYQPFPNAQIVLAEFGGLHIGDCGAGVDCARSDIEIDPNLAIHLFPELKAVERSINSRLFPLGEVHRGHGYLVIDENGRIYLLSDELSRFAPSFARSLELLLLGKKPSVAEIEAAWGKDNSGGKNSQGSSGDR
jgi:hypothetical protein